MVSSLKTASKVEQWATIFPIVESTSFTLARVPMSPYNINLHDVILQLAIFGRWLHANYVARVNRLLDER